MKYKSEQVILQPVTHPILDCAKRPVELSDETMSARKEKVLNLMRREKLDVLAVYADVEHGANFEYLTGFIPRFEEGLLILHSNGTMYLGLGNENLNKVPYSRNPALPLSIPYFSLPNQPMDNDRPLRDILMSAGFKKGQRVGLIGWKLFSSRFEDNRKLFDVPHFIVETLRSIIEDDGYIENRIDLFIHGDYGVRTINNANEIAHYEFGASLASDNIMTAMNQLDEGVSEMRLGSLLNEGGQRNTVVTIASAGARFLKANLYPTDRTVALGTPVSLTVAFKGGLSSRAGYAVRNREDLPVETRDYLEMVAKPYFAALATWLSNIRIGMQGDAMYHLIEQVLPKETYRWFLNPGHLTSDEEWLTSTVYPGSTETFKSGMLVQTDIIPSVSGYHGVSAESTIVLADQTLREILMKDEPELWQRILKRRKFIQEELNIKLPDEVLPMCSGVAYLRPFLLSKGEALAIRDAELE